jgi:hypothetical protein
MLPVSLDCTSWLLFSVTFIEFWSIKEIKKNKTEKENKKNENKQYFILDIVLHKDVDI